MSKPNYLDEEDRQRIEARLRALSIAHNPDERPETIVHRAKAYVDFVEAK